MHFARQQGINMRTYVLKHVNHFLILSCLVGAFLSFYGYRVECMIKDNPNFAAPCDISEHVSCSKAFSSEYGKGFGFVGEMFGNDSIFNLPNSISGLFYYIVLAVFCLFEDLGSVRIQVLLVLLSNVFSIYLSFILFFVLRSLCTVCLMIYFVNLANLYLVLNKYRIYKEQSTEETVQHPKHP